MSKAERLFAWVTQYPDGTVGTVGAFVPELGTMTPLVSRDRDVIERLRPLAVAHAKRAGQRVWLREYRDFVDHGDA